MGRADKSVIDFCFEKKEKKKKEKMNFVYIFRGSFSSSFFKLSSNFNTIELDISIIESNIESGLIRHQMRSCFWQLVVTM